MVRHHSPKWLATYLGYRWIINENLVQISQGIFKLLVGHHFSKWVTGGHIGLLIRLKYNPKPWIEVNHLCKFQKCILRRSQVISGRRLTVSEVKWWVDIMPPILTAEKTVVMSEHCHHAWVITSKILSMEDRWNVDVYHLMHWANTYNLENNNLHWLINEITSAWFLCLEYAATVDLPICIYICKHFRWNNNLVFTCPIHGFIVTGKSICNFIIFE